MESSAPGIRSVLGITAFRRLWIALSLSSLGDWLGLLAQAALAQSIAGHSYASQSYAVAGVFVLRLVPAVLFGPIAGVVADRLDRRWTMVAGDGARCLLFVSIPLVHTLWWLFTATFLIEIAAMFWIPAKEATVPNLVPPRLLESANQVSLLTAYGTAPLAAGVFTLLALLTEVLARHWAFFTANPVNLALYFDALTFLFSALTIARLTEIPHRTAAERAAAAAGSTASPLRTLLDGWRFIGTDRRIRGLVVGITGAFAAGGAVIGLANVYVSDLHGGQAGYGVLFGSVFLGLAGGMVAGPRVLGDGAGISRERLFGAVICGAGLVLCVFAVIPNLVVGVLCALVVGFLGGTAWITGQTMLGRHVADELRGRTFAFVQSLIRVTLILILAVAPAVAGTIGRRRLRLPGRVWVTYGGAAITLFAAGLLAAGVGWVAYRMMDDVPGKSLRTELKNVLRRGGVAAGATATTAGGSGDARDRDARNGVSGLSGLAGAGRNTGGGWAGAPGSAAAGAAGAPAAAPTPAGSGHAYPGYFLAFEGGDGSGKSTQLLAVAAWLRAKGHEVVQTREPGGTELGTRLREIVLDARHAGAVSPRAEALIYAADRADHVERVIRPALARGAIVLTDRYIASSLAYQGAGRALKSREIELLSHWATEGLLPDTTILLDLDPAAAAARRTGPADRLELESLEFHSRVRRGYLDLAAAAPDKYLVIDAADAKTMITARIELYLESRMPPSPPERAAAERRREAEAAEERRREAERLAAASDEEREAMRLEAERQEAARAEHERRLQTRKEHRERLEAEARRIEKAAIEQIRGVAEPGTGRRPDTGSTPTNPANATNPTAPTAPTAPPAPAKPAAPSAPTTPPEAVDLTVPPAQSRWDVPDYVGEPELDGSGPAPDGERPVPSAARRPGPAPEGQEDR